MPVEWNPPGWEFAERGYPTFYADAEDWARHVGPLVEEVVAAWVADGWMIEERFLSELASDALRVILRSFPLNRPGAAIDVEVLEQALALKERWKRRALAAGYEPSGFSECSTLPVEDSP